VSGYHRLQACKALGRDEIPAVMQASSEEVPQTDSRKVRRAGTHLQRLQVSGSTGRSTARLLRCTPQTSEVYAGVASAIGQCHRYDVNRHLGGTHR